MSVEIRLLGPLSVVVDGHETALRSYRQRTLLAALALHRRRSIDRSRLVDILWRDAPPASANHALHVHVAALRKLLPGVIVTDASGYLLDVDDDMVDVHQFEQLLVEGRRRRHDDPAAAIAVLDVALGLWRGDALQGLEAEPFAISEIARLDGLRSLAIEERLGAALMLGDLVTVLANVESVMRRYPLRERLAVIAMRALYDAGRHLDALRVADDHRSALRGRGVLPGSEIVDLERRMLRHDVDDIAVPDPETQWTTSGGVHIAFQVLGAGPPLVVIPGGLSHLELRWQSAAGARQCRLLAAFARTIFLDKRGTGLSDRANDLPDHAEQAADVIAVMDAAGVARGILFGVVDGAAIAVHAAVRHPDRVAGLVLYAPAQKILDEPEGTGAVTAAALDFMERDLLPGISVEERSVLAPSEASNAEFARWWARYTAVSAGPGAAAAWLRRFRALDIRAELPKITVPTLVLVRRNETFIGPKAAQQVAAAIPGARYAELEGSDLLMWAGNVDALVDAVRSFVFDVGRDESDPRRGADIEAHGTKLPR